MSRRSRDSPTVAVLLASVKSTVLKGEHHSRAVVLTRMNLKLGAVIGTRLT